MALSATLNTQGKNRPLKSRKSATAPNRTRSIRLLPIAPPMIMPSDRALIRRSIPRAHNARPPTMARANTTSSQRPTGESGRSRPKLTPGFHTMFSWKNGRMWIGARCGRSRTFSTICLVIWSSATTSAAMA